MEWYEEGSAWIVRRCLGIGQLQQLLKRGEICSAYKTLPAFETPVDTPTPQIRLRPN